MEGVRVIHLTSPLEEPRRLLEDSLREKLHEQEQIPERITER